MSPTLKILFLLPILVALTYVPVVPRESEHQVQLPIGWHDSGVKLVQSGVIDLTKLEKLYQDRGGVPAELRQVLETRDQKSLVMTADNAPLLLNVFWAFGLGQHSAVLETGPMTDPQYGGAENFASTGGWPLARGESMDHYSRHNFVTLSMDQEQLVAKVAKQIYRPCCRNSTYFPDCNHGLAMLGLLELMAVNNVNESQMLSSAEKVNQLWFPELQQATPPGCVA